VEKFKNNQKKEHRKSEVTKMTCERCGFEGFEDDNYCRQCGEEYESFTCECGADVDEGDNYCYSCGAALEGVVEDDDLESGEQQPLEQSPQQSEVQQQNW